MQSLKDKLLKAGLVTEESANRAEAEKSEARKQAQMQRSEPSRSRPPTSERSGRNDGSPRRHESRSDSHERRELRVPKLPPLPGSKEANRQASRKQLEIDRKIREIVLATQVTYERGETPFYFVTRKNRLRRLELTAELARKLETGELAVVERPDPDKIDHSLVPPSAAEQILALSAKAVRFLNKAGAQVGFLTEAEISSRASEANDVDDHIAPNAEADHRADTTAEPESPPADTPETFIAIRRSPLSS